MQLPEYTSPNGQRDADVCLQYLEDNPLYDHEKPVQVTPNFADLENKTNVRLASGPVETIRDVRGKADQFSLDNNGFQYIKAPTQFTNWSSQPALAQSYLPELEGLLRREIEGCDEIMFYVSGPQAGTRPQNFTNHTNAVLGGI